jgi:hypothetical protein
LKLFKNDHMKDDAKSIVEGSPYERLCKISHIPNPQKKIISIINFFITIINFFGNNEAIIPKFNRQIIIWAL